MPLSLVPEIVVARNQQALRVERDDRGGSGIGDDVAADVAGDVFQPDGVAAAAGDRAIDQANVASAEAVHEAAPRRSGMPPPSRMILVRPMLPAPSPDNIDAHR